MVASQRRRLSGRASRTVTSLTEGGMMKSFGLHPAPPDNEFMLAWYQTKHEIASAPGQICQIMRLSA